MEKEYQRKRLIGKMWLIHDLIIENIEDKAPKGDYKNLYHELIQIKDQLKKLGV